MRSALPGIHEVSRKMRDTAGGTPALPFEEAADHSRGPLGTKVPADLGIQSLFPCASLGDLRGSAVNLF